MKQYTMMLALVVIVLMFQILTGGKLLFPMNVYNIINQNAYIVILAIGMLLCIIGSGSIDLSVGSVVGLVGACAGTFIMKWKWDPYLSIFLCMGVGILVGAWQGFWIAYVKIPAFIVTLSGMLVFRGATLIILQGGKAIPVFPDEYKQFFVGTTPEFIGVWEVAGMKIYLTCLLLGILIAAVFCVMQVLSNQSKKRKGYEYATPGALITRLVIISAIVIWFFTLLARYKGIPAVLLVLGRHRRHVYLYHQQNGARPPHLRDGRQREGRAPVRRQYRTAHVFQLCQHGPPGRYRRHGVSPHAWTAPPRWPATVSSWTPSAPASSAAPARTAASAR